MPSFKIIRLSVLEKNIFSIYGHGSHLGHVTWTIYIKFLTPFPRRCHLKFGEKKMFENNGHIHVYSPGAGGDSPCHKIGQGQPRVINYNNFVELESPMLHAKF